MTQRPQARVPAFDKEDSITIESTAETVSNVISANADVLVTDVLGNRET
jgi:hypothetical protein